MRHFAVSRMPSYLPKHWHPTPAHLYASQIAQEYKFIINFKQKMDNARDTQPSDAQFGRKYNMRQSHIRSQLPQRTQTREEKENAERLEHIRKKYSSNQRNAFMMKADKPKECPTTHPQEHLQSNQRLSRHLYEQSFTQFARQSYVSRSQQPLKEIQSKQPIKQSTQEMLRQSRIPQKELVSSHTKSVNLIQPGCSGYMNRSTSTHMRPQLDKSKQKVSERVSNITQINQRIKDLLSRFDYTAPNQETNISRRPVPETKENVETSFKDKKAAFKQSHLKVRDSYEPFSCKNTPVVEESKFTKYKSQLEKLEIRTVSIVDQENENLIDQSFVLQKHNPREKEASKQFQDLIYKLSTQIEYDEQLRTAKYFLLLSTKEDKYQKLSKELELKGVKYSLQDLKVAMKFTEQQYNPFIYEPAHQNFSKFAEALITAIQHWEKNISKKFNSKQLKEKGFDQMLLPESKGEGLQVTDLVRFVNLCSGNLYKTRDLVLIARRIGEPLSKEKVLKAFCRNP